MNDVEVLHNAVRLYCVERHAEWCSRYRELMAAERANRISIRAGDPLNPPSGYSDAAYGVFPRYLLLEAILSDIERFVPGDFSSLDELRDILVAVAETAQPDGPSLTHRDALAAMNEERREFVAFIRSTDVREWADRPRLPFRRVLGTREHRERYDAFCRRWGKWYGGAVDRPAPDADCLTLHVLAMEPAGAYDALRKTLGGHGVTRVLELREWGDAYELETSAASFRYNGAEGYWTADDAGWMVYASHEASITFGGSWLIEAMRRRLPHANSYFYRTWESAAYPPPPSAIAMTSR